MYKSKTDLELMVGKNEKILWMGKPDKRCYVLEGIFNPMLPFAFVWLMFDSIFIAGGIWALFTGDKIFGIGILIFMLLHLMPVWIYLCGVIFVHRRYKHTQYIITDKGVYISGGLFSYSCQMKPFTELARVNIYRGIIDQMLGVGDVVMMSNVPSENKFASSGSSSSYIPGLKIEDIRNYQKIFELIKKLQEDIYTDTMYPNDLRPAENHGYKTEYKGPALDM